MRNWDVDLVKPIEDYFKHKPGDVLTAPDTGEKYIINSEKYVTSDITSYDISIGGIHHYPIITVVYLSVSPIDEPDIICMGYLGGLNIDTILTIELTTPLTKKDRRRDPNRYAPHQERTTGFLTEEDAKEAIENFKKKYLLGWRDYDYVEEMYIKEKEEIK